MPNCILEKDCDTFTIYYEARGRIDSLTIFQDKIFLSTIVTYNDPNFPNIILSIAKNNTFKNSKFEIFNKDTRIEFTVDSENTSVLITPNIGGYLLDIIEDESSEIGLKEVRIPIDQEVIIEFFNFDYVYDYIAAYNCFIRNGGKLQH
jgi:hypothetical protein